MTSLAPPTDLEIAALLASRICHDVIGPVGAINNGLEILDEEDDPNARNYALEMIKNVTNTASAALQFARFAFGASGSAGALIDLTMAEQISRGYVVQGKGKHKLSWTGQPGHMQKDKVKLLLNLVAAAITALPRGGEISVLIEGTLEDPGFEVRCRGTGARPPQHLNEFITGVGAPALDAMTIQAYYTVRLAEAAGMSLAIERQEPDIILAARKR